MAFQLQLLLWLMVDEPKEQDYLQIFDLQKTADGVLIGRPVSLAAIAYGPQGVHDYFMNLKNELTDVMLMSGCATISDITRDKITVVKD